MEVKALACSIPGEHGLPFSRFSHADIAREAMERGITASISGATVWRWLSADAIKPWSHRSWIFPRDPGFAEKAACVLDLYQGFWEGNPLGPNDYVISADEKTSIQARSRIAHDAPPAPKKIRKVEFEYQRKGYLAYMAAWDVHRAKIFGQCEQKTGIDAFHSLVDLVMTREPYCSADHVFWITDNGPSHRGANAVQRLQQWYPNAIQVFTPVHASWLNQIEIYFSIVQRKVLTPNNFADLNTLQDHLLRFQTFYEQIAKPFQWKFTQEDLKRMLDKISSHNMLPRAA
ncbi:MAG TPA: IS630 family transposase [bacterium]|nr:IS630 family transposase [bacterium]